MKCHSERSEESRSGSGRSEDEKIRARFFAEFTVSTQSEILRCAQDDSEGLRMTGEGLRMTEHLEFDVRNSEFTVYNSLFLFGGDLET